MRSRYGLRRGTGGTAAAVLLLMLLASLSCRDDPVSLLVGPPERMGAIEGYVRAGGDPVEVTVGARQTVDPGMVPFKTRSNPTGWYRLELPVGAYRIEIDPVDYGYISSRRDTIHVGSGTRRLDLLRGKLTLELTAPPDLEGRTFRCSLDPVNRPSGPYRSVYASVTVQSGRATLTFAPVEALRYKIFLDLGRVGVWLPGTYDPAAADVVVVPVDRPVAYRAALDRWASVSGSIRGSWQSTYGSSPFVAAYGLDSTFVNLAVTGTDGDFTLEIPVAVPVKLQVEIDGIEQWIGGDTFETATRFDLQPGDHLADVSVIESGILCRLQGPGVVSERQSAFLLRHESGRTYRFQAYNRNPVPICNLRPGRYSLFVYGYCDYDGAPWASQWYDGADSLAAATSIDLPEGQLVPITVHLAPGGAIEGRLLTAEGEGVPTAWVALFDPNGAPLCDGWHYINEGSFAMTGLGNADYYIAADIAGSPWWYPGTREFDSAQVIHIRDHATVTGIEWKLPADAKGAHR